ncbi:MULTISPECIES: hypothetical protein [Nocardiaceae]|uniref:hypothetical protein n=1 Tax=Nocardiaceae TaxID=85025 RepID=UPI000B2D25F3|nr:MULTISPECIES: hypothetical protein [Rhodococcus]
MAKIRSISPSTQRVKSAPTEVDCQFAVFHDKDENKILHLSTFGSDNRVSAPKSSQSIQLDLPMAEQLVELLIDTFQLSPGGSSDIVWSRPGSAITLGRAETSMPSSGSNTVPIQGSVGVGRPDSKMNDKVEQLVEGEQFRRQYDRFRPRFSPLSIGMMLSELIEANGQASFGEVAEVLGIRPGRVRQSVAVLSQVINEDSANILSENGTEVRLNPALLFEQFRVN